MRTLFILNPLQRVRFQPDKLVRKFIYFSVGTAITVVRRMYALKWDDGRLGELYQSEEKAFLALFETQERCWFLAADAGLESIPWNPQVVSVLVWQLPHWLERLAR